jgi:hypothetical protein
MQMITDQHKHQRQQQMPGISPAKKQPWDRGLTKPTNDQINGGIMIPSVPN